MLMVLQLGLIPEYSVFLFQYLGAGRANLYLLIDCLYKSISLRKTILLRLKFETDLK